MAEHIPQESDQPNEPTDWSVLADSYQNWHPALQPHVESYFQKQGVNYTGQSTENAVGAEVAHRSALLREAHNLRTQQQRCKTLIGSSATENPEQWRAVTAMLNTYDGLAKVQMRDVYDALQGEVGYTIDDVRQVISVVADTLRFTALHKDTLGIEEESIENDHALPFLASLSPNTLQQLYSQRDTPEGMDFIYVLNRSAQARNTDIDEAAQVLAHTLNSSIASLVVADAPLLKPGIDTTIGRPEYGWVALNDWSTELPPGMSQPEYNARLMRESLFILANSGLPDEMVYELIRASDERSLQRKGGIADYSNPAIDVDVMKLMVGGTLNNVEMIGADTCALLYETCGITNFDYYTTEELRRMKRFVDSDPTFLDHLKDGDVTVVLTDARGDHNGAFRFNTNMFSDTNNRTLFFEINRPSDLYRYMIWVHKQGIMPSTLVLGAHGHPGEMLFGKAGQPEQFRLHNMYVTAESADTPDPSLQTARGFARIVAEYMQDGRGIDGPDEAVGKRRLVLASCSQAVQRHVVTNVEEAKRRGLLRRKGEPIETQVMESTAETLVRVGAHPNLEVYAADASVIMKTSEKGVEFWQPDDNGSLRRPIKRHRQSADGTVIVDDQDEIIVRREPAA
jgi:hypothetical protein